jgi:hypothetical protein
MASLPSGYRPRADNDIYTALVIVGFGFVVATIGFVIYRCTELFGTAFPGFS